MKNMSLFIVKRITENIQISDEAFVVWCGLRSIMGKDETEYFVNHNVLAFIQSYLRRKSYPFCHST